MNPPRGMRFEWDDANVRHIAAHGVTPAEAEEAFADPLRVGRTAYNTPTEERDGIVGMTGAGRLLTVIFTVRRGAVRVISAHDADARDRRRYRTGS